MHKYVADREIRVYHTDPPLEEECRNAMQIDVSTTVRFDSRVEAEKAGYSPCEVCVLKTSD